MSLAHSALIYGRKIPGQDSLALARIHYRAACRPPNPGCSRLAVRRAIKPVGGYTRQANALRISFK